MAEKYLNVSNFNNGTGTITLGKDNNGEYLDCGKYILRLDYEAKNSLQACQLARTIVVGHRSTVTGGICHVPYATSATSNASIPVADKLGTTCRCTVTVLNKETGQPVANLPLYIGVGVGDAHNYYENDVDYNTIVANYNNSKKLSTPFTTNSNGVATIQFTLSQLFNTDTITGIETNTNHWNTIYIRVDGTTDRASNDNYVRSIGCSPAIIGNVPVSSKEIIVQPAGTGARTAKTCGRGTFRVDLKIKYSFAFEGSTPLTGFEAYDTASKLVKTGTLQLQTSTTGSNWENVPTEFIKIGAGSNSTINNDGEITLDTHGNYTSVIIQTQVQYNYTGTVYYRFIYHGKVGSENNYTLGTITVNVNPDYPSYDNLTADIELYHEDEPIYMVEGNAKNVLVAVYRHEDYGREHPLESGEIEYKVE